MDLEQSFYLFIRAVWFFCLHGLHIHTLSTFFFFKANSVLSKINDLPPYVLFALDNIVRRIAEQLVGFIRSGKAFSFSYDCQFVFLCVLDFIPAAVYRVPSTPNGDRASSVDESTNDEVTRLYQQYRKLADKNRE